LRHEAAGIDFSDTKVLLLRRGSTIKETIVGFNRGKFPNRMRNAVIATREKEGVNLRKWMMRYTEKGLSTMTREEQKIDAASPAGRREMRCV
jgi:hypothetical protein